MQPQPAVVDKSGTVLVPMSGTVLWAPELPDLPTDIINSREDVVKLTFDRVAKRFTLTGLAPGLAQLTFLFKDQPRMVFEVAVEPDLALLRNVIRRTIPTAQVEVQAGLGRMIVLSGYVTSPQDADTLTRLASVAAGNPNLVINAVQVGGVQEVQIDVVVASVDRSMARFRGLDFAQYGKTVTFQSIVSGLITSSQIIPSTGGSSGSSLLTVSPAANLQLAVVPSQFLLALQALRTEGLAKFLAEPKVVTQTGRPAFFRAGGQQAILSGTSGITGPGVTLVPFGTELEVLPIVYGNGMIWLEINPRITAVSTALGITVGGSVSPGFTEQQVKAAVMLESGQTYAIGGLIQTTIQASSSKVPVLGDLPYLGVAFSSITHTQTESELVILVTPRLVGPMTCDQVPKRVPGRETRNPDDYELFLENILEAPRGQRKVWNGCCYNAAYKCDPTAAIFPCVGGVCTGRPPMAPAIPLNGRPTPPPPSAPPPAAPPAGQMPASAEGASAIPVVPGSPVRTVEPTSGTQQPGLPPVIILPDVPRN
jgi:pilus assembly protein CpaC